MRRARLPDRDHVPVRSAALQAGRPGFDKGIAERSVGIHRQRLHRLARRRDRVDIARGVPTVERLLGDRAEHRAPCARRLTERSEEHTSELQSLMRISYAVFCLKKKKTNK